MDDDRNWIAVGLSVVCVLVLAMVIAGLAGVWDDDPTQADANEQFCDDVGVFSAALGDLQDLDGDTPIDEFQENREQVRIAYDNMIQSAFQVKDARVDDLEEANNQLQAAIDDIDDDATLQEAKDAIEDEANEVSKQLGQMLNNVECGSDQGTQEQSDE